MSPHAKRLWSAMREQRGRRSLRFYRHHANLTSTRAVDAANALLASGVITGTTNAGVPIKHVHDNESVLLEINHNEGSNR